MLNALPPSPTCRFTNSEDVLSGRSVSTVLEGHFGDACALTWISSNRKMRRSGLRKNFVGCCACDWGVCSSNVCQAHSLTRCAVSSRSRIPFCRMIGSVEDAGAWRYHVIPLDVGRGLLNVGVRRNGSANGVGWILVLFRPFAQYMESAQHREERGSLTRNVIRYTPGGYTDKCHALLYSRQVPPQKWDMIDEKFSQIVIRFSYCR